MKFIKIVALIVLGIIVLILGFCYFKSKSEEKAIFTIAYSVVNEIYTDDTQRDFHGDGFSITVDSISNDDANYFSNPPNVFFTDYPKEIMHINKYEMHKWKKTPFTIKDTTALHFALNLSPKDSDSYVFKDRVAVIKNLTAMSKKLNQPGNLYAFAFRNHPYGLYGIDLFLIDIKGHKVYKVNRQ